MPVRIDPSGASGPTLKETARGAWRRTSRGLYLPTYVDPSPPQQRIVEAAAAAPEETAVTGWAGLHWAGGRWFSGLEPDGRTERPVPLALHRNRTMRPQRGLLLSEQWLPDGQVVLDDGLPLTPHARSVCFEVRRAASLKRQVAILDMAAFSDLVSLDEVADYALAHLAGHPFVRRVARSLEHADENAWSPRESVMRIEWTVEAGYPRPLCNVPIFDASGNHLVTPDLFDPNAGVAGEYDGVFHGEGGRRFRDVNREEIYKDLGLELVTMVSLDNRYPDAFAARLHAAYRRAGRRRRTGSWTLDRPDWWVDTSTVARRRALSEAERARWLRRQAA